MKRGQGTIEYLLLIVGALVLVAVVALVLSSMLSPPQAQRDVQADIIEAAGFHVWLKGYDTAYAGTLETAPGAISYYATGLMEKGGLVDAAAVGGKTVLLMQGKYKLNIDNETGKAWLEKNSTHWLEYNGPVPAVAGQPPVADAGADQSITLSGGWVETGEMPGSTAGSASLLINSIVEDEEGNIYASTTDSMEGSGKVYKSSDRGASWVAAADPPVYGGINSMIYADGILYVAVENTGVFKSTDKGASWEPTGDMSPWVHSPLLTRLSDGALYLVATSIHSGPNIFKSTDQGGTWAPLAARPLPDGWLFELVEDKEGNFYISAMVAIPPDGADQVFKSVDRGASWAGPLLSNSPNSNQKIPLLAASDGWLYAGTRPYIYRSNDKGASWEPSYSPTAGVFSFMEASDGTIYAGGSFVPAATGLKTTDHGETWETTFTGPVTSWVDSLLQASDGSIYAGLASNTEGIVFKLNAPAAEAVFSGSAEGGAPPYSWEWGFGDGTGHSFEQSPAHTYTASGAYTVTLAVTDSGGLTATDTATVTVS